MTMIHFHQATANISPDIVWMHEDGAADVSIVGGKGANLAEMTRAGFRVPEAFVVSTRTFTQAIDLDRLRALLADADYDAARVLAADVSLPPGPIAEAYERLGCGPVAVRSSASGEDSRASSFAGQQETFLNVKGEEALLTRVHHCWASLFSDHALLYRKRRGDVNDLSMAVVVQRMVAAEKAGVVFTADPVAGRRDILVVEAVSGLGDSLVSGEQIPSHYEITTSGDTIASQVVGDSGLTRDELEKLVVVARRLERLFAFPQDIEWAIADGRVHLLQSRPITTL